MALRTPPLRLFSLCSIFFLLFSCNFGIIKSQTCAHTRRHNGSLHAKCCWMVRFLLISTSLMTSLPLSPLPHIPISTPTLSVYCCIPRTPLSHLSVPRPGLPMLCSAPQLGGTRWRSEVEERGGGARWRSAFHKRKRFSATVCGCWLLLMRFNEPLIHLWLFSN